MANSGWTNDAVDTLTVPTGAVSGERVIIANQADGDAIDIYNTSNTLVFSIDGTGRLVARSSVSTAEVVINGANLLFEDLAETPLLPPLINGSLGPDQTSLRLFAGQPQHAGVGVNGCFIILATGDTSASEWINAEQRGVQGAVVQTDSSANAGQLVHADSYSGTTNAGGHLVFNHNAQFTPLVVSITGTTSGGTFANLTWGVNAKTATQLDVNFTIANTGAPWANNLITFDAVMYG